MLDNHLKMQETENKYKIMENRLKRLEEEERRAQKNQAMAEQKAADMMNSRARHYDDLMAKINHYDEKNRQLLMQRQKNLIEQSTRRDMIRQNREKFFHDNMQKKQQVAELNQALKNAKNENNDAEFNHKKDLWRKVMTQKMGL